MSGRWTAQLSTTSTSTSVGVGALQNAHFSSSVVRLKLTEFVFSSDAATLGTSDFRLEVKRSTSQPTGSLITPFPIDPIEGQTTFSSGDQTTVRSFVWNPITANGTLGGIVISTGLGEQATFSWKGYAGSEIVIPASSDNGLHFMTPVCGNNPSASCQITWEEL